MPTHSTYTNLNNNRNWFWLSYNYAVHKIIIIKIPALFMFCNKKTTALLNQERKTLATIAAVKYALELTKVLLIWTLNRSVTKAVDSIIIRPQEATLKTNKQAKYQWIGTTQLSVKDWILEQPVSQAAARSVWSRRSEVQISSGSNRTRCCQRLATDVTFLQKELCCPGAMTRGWAQHTRNTLRRNTTSIMKDLIDIEFCVNIHVLRHRNKGIHTEAGWIAKAWRGN